MRARHARRRDGLRFALLAAVLLAVVLFVTIRYGPDDAEPSQSARAAASSDATGERPEESTSSSTIQRPSGTNPPVATTRPSTPPGRSTAGGSVRGDEVITVDPPDGGRTTTSDPFQPRPELGDPGCAILRVRGGRACAVRPGREIRMVVAPDAGTRTWLTLEAGTSDDRLAAIAQGVIDNGAASLRAPSSRS